VVVEVELQRAAASVQGFAVNYPGTRRPQIFDLAKRKPLLPIIAPFADRTCPQTPVKPRNEKATILV